MYIHFIPKFFQSCLGFILVKSKLGVEANLFKLCMLQSYPETKQWEPQKTLCVHQKNYISASLKWGEKKWKGVKFNFYLQNYIPQKNPSGDIHMYNY